MIEDPMLLPCGCGPSFQHLWQDVLPTPDKDGHRIGYHCTKCGKPYSFIQIERLKAAHIAKAPLGI